MATPSGDDANLDYEVCGNLRLKRGRGKTGYAGVYPANSKVRPFMAQIKNERTGKVQSIGSFETAQQAAVAYMYPRAMMDARGPGHGQPSKATAK